MDFPGWLNRAIDLVTAAFDFFHERVLGLPAYRDLWTTTSGNPCVFCRAMEQLSRQVIVPIGQPFPVPRPEIQVYMNEFQITYTEPRRAHDDCQCIRETVPYSR